ncbi:accessory gene regulator ArgB-like protein [Brevibacillus reuszeri]|uniref:accessory gene regulator ArgB-like protein n=1 Tax=Brevibacillus reuszeri TaxID=54915 RepID=UPI0013E03251|nr:accessory gene regulator B family protein [Brevibacillus reuszeri]
MIEALAIRIAHKIKHANPIETNSVEIMAYSLSILINTFAVIGTSLVIAFFLGTTWDTFLSIFSFAILRMASGGHHARNLTICFVVSTGLFVLIPFIPLDDNYVIFVNLFTLLLVAVLSPHNGEKNNIPKRLYPLFKSISIVLVLSSLIYSNESIALSMLAQALLLIPFRGRR